MRQYLEYLTTHSSLHNQPLWLPGQVTSPAATVNAQAIGLWACPIDLNWVLN